MDSTEARAVVKVVLTGGAGFVGERLAKALQNVTHDRVIYQVLLVDVVPAPHRLSAFPFNEAEHARAAAEEARHGAGSDLPLLYSVIDLRDAGALRRALSAFLPDIVVHLASYGMSGAAMLSDQCRSINVNGTRTLLALCRELGISRFIYTSSYNVIFGRSPIHGGNEEMDYCAASEHSDQYSASKAIAERLVLEANGTTVSTPSVTSVADVNAAALSAGVRPLQHCRMLTASIRPAAIYGEGEQRHLPRIVRHMDGGMFLFRIGAARVDWVHVDNLVRGPPLPRVLPNGTCVQPTVCAASPLADVH